MHITFREMIFFSQSPYSPGNNNLKTKINKEMFKYIDEVQAQETPERCDTKGVSLARGAHAARPDHPV